MITNPLSGIGIQGRDQLTQDSLGPTPQLFLQDIYTIARYPLARLICTEIPDDIIQAGIKIAAEDVTTEEMGAWREYIDEACIPNSLRDGMVNGRFFGAGFEILYIDDGRPMSEPVDTENIRSVVSVVPSHRWELTALEIDSSPAVYSGGRWTKNANYGMPRLYSFHPWSFSPSTLGSWDLFVDGNRNQVEQRAVERGGVIHGSRVCLYPGQPLPMILQRDNAFYPDPSLRPCLQAVLDWYGHTHNAANAGRHLSELVYTSDRPSEAIDTPAAGIHTAEQAQRYIARLLAEQNQQASYNGVRVLSMDEKLEYLARPLSGFDQLTQVIMINVAMSSGYPLEKLFKISPPGGIGAAGAGRFIWDEYESEVRKIAHNHIFPARRKLYEYAALAKDGPLRRAVPFKLELGSLTRETPLERATRLQAEAAVMAERQQNGWVSAKENRGRLKSADEDFQTLRDEDDEEALGQSGQLDLSGIGSQPALPVPAAEGETEPTRTDEADAIPESVRRAVNRGIVAARQDGWQAPGWETVIARSLANGRQISISQRDQLAHVLETATEPLRSYLGGNETIAWLHTDALGSESRTDSDSVPTTKTGESNMDKNSSMTRVSGFDVNIQYPAGASRFGRPIPHAYGEIVGTIAADGEPVDAYVGPFVSSPFAYVISQLNPDGTPDELKIMLGFDSPGSAIKAYTDSIDTVLRFGALTAIPVQALPAYLAVSNARSDAGEFREEDHPRAADGKFGSGGGKSSETKAEKSEKSGGKHDDSAKSSGTKEKAEKPKKTSAQDTMAAVTVVDGKRRAADGGELPPHISSLTLPPAWTDVKYSTDPNADLLAIGKDSKGRPQYVYSEKFASKQAEAKFERIEELRTKFKDIHAENEINRQSSNPTTKDSADALRLIMQTGIRPGGDEDTGAKVKAYGASTLQAGHVQPNEDGTVNLRFTGKKGVSLDIPVKDPETAQMLIARKAAAEADDAPIFPRATDSTLRDLVHTYGGGGFKTKDFRTHHGTSLAYNEVSQRPVPTDEKAYKAAVMDVAKIVSKALGNTPSVALESYINPAVFAGWRHSNGGNP